MPGLPIGIPMTLAGFILAWLMMAIQTKNSDDDSGKANWVGVIISMAAGVGAVIFGVTGTCMILFWLFGGSAVGFWFTFGSLASLTDLAAARVLIGPSTVMITALATLFF